jgi:uncharacterized protein YcaQ
VGVHELSRADARRIAVRAQLLDHARPAALLEFMVQRGEVAVAGRRNGDRLWDLAARVYPDDPVIPADEALRTRNERRLRALGIARARGPECPVRQPERFHPSISIPRAWAVRTNLS